MSAIKEKPQANIMMIGMAVLLCVFSVVVWISLSSVSAAASNMGRGKDVVSDVLPPPLFIIEAELTLYQIMEAEPEQRAPLLARMAALRADYERRNLYWEKSAELDPNVRKLLLGDQKVHADAFWALALGEFATAVHADDMRTARAVQQRAMQHATAHRQAVDQTVKVAAHYADQTLASLHDISTEVRWATIGFAALGLVLLFLL